MKKIIKYIFLGSLYLLYCIFLANTIIVKNSKSKLYNSVEKIPKNKVGLLLGAGKYLGNGYINLYYQYRIDATVRLFKAGKITTVIVSGDNGVESYDEPTTFKNDLIKAGVPEDSIVLDYAGFRTLDSVVRAKEVFGQDSMTIISQKFHNERAIYLADYFGIKAIGFNAAKVGGRFALKTNIREYLARVKVFVDILLRIKPKFLGAKIVVN